jgi:hypothetical protein
MDLRDHSTDPTSASSSCRQAEPAATGRRDPGLMSEKASQLRIGISRRRGVASLARALLSSASGARSSRRTSRDIRVPATCKGFRSARSSSCAA